MPLNSILGVLADVGSYWQTVSLSIGLSHSADICREPIVGGSERNR